jgi:Zn-dependent protease with chaperone function
MLVGCLSGQASAQAPVDGYIAYTVADEATLGREAAEVIRGHLATVTDESVTAYVRTLAERLMAAIPPALVQPEFDYGVGVLNDDQVTSVALPGGPIFISRGMIELATSEGELAGVIAHELGHMALGDAARQATAGERYQLGAITGRILGETFSEDAAGILDRGVQFPATAYFLTYHREHERHANALAAQVLAQSGYDPLALAVMMQSIALDARRGGARWARRHPAPASDRAGFLETLAGELAVGEAAPAPPRSMAFALMQSRVRALPRGRHNGVAPHPRPAPPRTVGHGAPLPSGAFTPAPAGDRVRLAVPADWHRLPRGNTVVFAPEGTYDGAPDMPLAATHGVQVGVARSLTGNLQGDVRRLLGAFARGNAHFIWTLAFTEQRIGGRSGITTRASNVSPVTGAFEQVLVSAVHLPDDSLLYVIAVAPEDEAGVSRHVVARVLDSIEILD